MISDAIKAAGLSFILGMRIPRVPYGSLGGGARTPANRSPTGRHSPSPGRSVIYYQYRHDRARRILRTEPTRVRRSPWDRGSCYAR